MPTSDRSGTSAESVQRNYPTSAGPRVPEVVFQVLDVLQRVERLVIDRPAATSRPSQLAGTVRADRQIRDSSELPLRIFAGSTPFRTLQHLDDLTSRPSQLAGTVRADRQIRDSSELPLRIFAGSTPFRTLQHLDLPIGVRSIQFYLRHHAQPAVPFLPLGRGSRKPGRI